MGAGLGADVVGSVLTGMWSSGVGSVNIGYGSESSVSCTGTCIGGDSGGARWVRDSFAIVDCRFWLPAERDKVSWKYWTNGTPGHDSRVS